MSCAQIIQPFGTTPDQIRDNLKRATSATIHELFDCMTRDFQIANPNRNVRLPRPGSKSALCLLALYLAYKAAHPWFPKSLLDQLNETDCQFPRHAPRIYGLQIISSTHTFTNFPTPPRGSHAYALVSLALTDPAPSRHVGINDDDFERLKSHYGYRCATCGAEEGKLHYNPYYARSEVVVLQKGHMNPNLPLEPGNIIPQCQFCNRAYRNWLVFDRHGRTVGVSEWTWVIRSLKRGYLKGQPPQQLLELIFRVLRGSSIEEDTEI